MKETFRSLRVRDFRLWFVGAFVSNIGTWMQATARNWVVLSELTDSDATALGITAALQFAPPVLLAPVAGWLADRVDRRRLMMATQSAMLVLGVLLGVLLLFDLAELWHLFFLAGGLGDPHGDRPLARRDRAAALRVQAVRRTGAHHAHPRPERGGRFVPLVVAADPCRGGGRSCLSRPRNGEPRAGGWGFRRS